MECHHRICGGSGVRRKRCRQAGTGAPASASAVAAGFVAAAVLRCCHGHGLGGTAVAFQPHSHQQPLTMVHRLWRARQTADGRDRRKHAWSTPSQPRSLAGGEGRGGGEEATERPVRTLLIDNYDSYTYNLYQQLALINGEAPFVAYNDDFGGDLQRLVDVMMHGVPPDSIVLSPGPGSPLVSADFGMCTQALADAAFADIPILGVCLGHQGLGHAHGAAVVRAPEVMHGRLSGVYHSGDALFKGIRQGFEVVRYHSLVVEPSSFLSPSSPLLPIAWTADGVLMGLRHAERPHYGVQFHPESVATEGGDEVIKNFRDITRKVRREGSSLATRPGVNNIGWSGERGGSRSSSISISSSSSSSSSSSGTSKVSLAEGGVEGISNVNIWTGLNRPEKHEQQQQQLVIQEEVRVQEPEGLASKYEKEQQPGFVALFKEIDLQRSSSSNKGAGSGPSLPLAPPLATSEQIFLSLFGHRETAWWLDSSSLQPQLEDRKKGFAKARFSYMGGVEGRGASTVEYYLQDKEAGVGEVVTTDADTGRKEVLRGRLLDFLKRQIEGWNGNGGSGSSEGRIISKGGGGARGNRVGGVTARRIGQKGATSAAEVGDTTASEEEEEAEEEREELPFPFVGGYVGYFGYELRHETAAVLSHTGGQAWTWQHEELQAVDGGEGELGEGAQAGAAAAQTGRPDVPTAFWVFANRFVAYDHETQRAYAVALVRDGGTKKDENQQQEEQQQREEEEEEEEEEGEARAWIEETASRISLLAASQGQQTVSEAGGMKEEEEQGKKAEQKEQQTPRLRPRPLAVCRSNRSRKTYEDNLRECIDLIGRGETYEVCLTNQLETEQGLPRDKAPLDLYLLLRRSNPAPYAAFIKHDPQRRFTPYQQQDTAVGDTAGTTTGGGRALVGREAKEGQGEGQGEEGGGPSFALCCSSPEKFLRINRAGLAESKPIKGTNPRGATPEQDAALADELLTSEKVIAENLMIVDLVRNDLGRVCEVGSVRVPDLMHVESYANVHQLVSKIEGQLLPGVDVVDVLAASFPGGSMTGSPKRRTLEIIDHLEEGQPRGVYSGSLGFMGVDGSSELNIVIRTAVAQPDGRVTVGAGGAVTAMSDVTSEYEEMLLKANSVLKAVRLLGGGGEEREGKDGSKGGGGVLQVVDGDGGGEGGEEQEGNGVTSMSSSGSSANSSATAASWAPPAAAAGGRDHDDGGDNEGAGVLSEGRRAAGSAVVPSR